MAEEVTETSAQRDARVEAAEKDRANRAEKAPLTGALTTYDVLRHLVQYGPPAGPEHRAELLAVLDANDPAVKNEPKAKPEEAGRQAKS